MFDDSGLIDVENALSRIGGKKALYKNLLIYFLNDNHVDELCSAISDGNNDESGRLAHTLKGVSANLSLMKLREISTEIEVDLKNDVDCTPHISRLREAFDDTVILINAYINSI
jgi:HPt (histidine-containing phosphotransfer) domain-containing protein